MIAADLAEIATVTGGELYGDPVAFVGIGIDTRQPLDGVLYVALRGERFDGHEFAGAARIPRPGRVP